MKKKDELRKVIREIINEDLMLNQWAKTKRVYAEVWADQEIDFGQMPDLKNVKVDDVPNDQGRKLYVIFADFMLSGQSQQEIDSVVKDNIVSAASGDVEIGKIG